MCLVAVSLTLWEPIDCSPPGSSVHGDSPGKSTGVGCHALLQVILPTRGSNPGLPHCRWILNCLNYQRSSRIREWAAYPFSKGTSPPRDQTKVSCIAGRVFFFFCTQSLYQLSYSGSPFLCRRQNFSFFCKSQIPPDCGSIDLEILGKKGRQVLETCA